MSLNGRDETRLRLGSRESPLALVQTQLVADMLMLARPDLRIEIRTFKTRGDRFLESPLSRVGGKGLFVKELEDALLADEIDLAVHSMKDMPGLLPPGLTLLSVGQREDPRDVLLSRDGCGLTDLAPGATVGTSSLRREALLKRLRPDLHFATLRGNLQTRYRKLTDGDYDAIVLAAAGVNRLGWADRIAGFLDPWTECVPAAAQGILAVEYRQEDDLTHRLLEPLSVPAVETAQRAERAVLAVLEGGCQLPLGVHCRPLSSAQNGAPEETAGYEIKGVVLSPDGSCMVEATLPLDGVQPAESGRSLGELLLSRGAREILDCLPRFISISHP